MTDNIDNNSNSFSIDIDDFKEIGEEVNTVNYHINAAIKGMNSLRRKCEKIEDKCGIKMGYTEFDFR